MRVMERIRSATDGFGNLTFDEIRLQAPRILETLLPVAQLEITDRSPFETPTQHGFQEIAAHGNVYRDFYLGPPGPLWFVVSGIDRAAETEAVLELFFDRLLAALAGAGYTEELSRQARRDWLTGLPRMAALERELQAAPRLRSSLGIVDLRGSGTGEPGDDAGLKLAIRRLARAVRMLLTDDEQAFHLGSGRLALLVPESEQVRFNAFLDREAAGAPRGWAGLAEARGIEVLKLAKARMFSASLDVTAAVSPPGRGCRTARSVPLKVMSGSRATLQLTRPVLSDWHFSKPVTLVFDLPLGYAQEIHDQVEGKVLIVTRGISLGYLLDLRDSGPDGLVQEPANLSELRNQLQQVADGERLYAGPVLDDALLPRERAVWRLAARGYQNEEIAGMLKIAPKTVSNYISSLLEKLGHSHRSALALAYWAEADG